MRRLPALALLVALLIAPEQATAQGFPFDLFGGGEPRRERPPAARLRPPQRRAAPPTAVREPRKPARESKKLAPKPKTQPAPPPAAAEPPPAPYDPQLQRLAELLGGLAYLRDLCGDKDGESWRDMMARLRDADAPSGPRRQRLTAAFNRGFSDYQLTYRDCTPNARLVIARHLAETQGLAREVSARYGNP
ncbi:MAG TPA: TIGR02301 family protein [Methylocystis sp.]|nr:TIGR02301 family protein [Methylocystis sp.]